MSKLPDELRDCVELQRLDLSHNSFVDCPAVIIRLPKLKVIIANNNYIMGKALGWAYREASSVVLSVVSCVCFANVYKT